MNAPARYRLGRLIKRGLFAEIWEATLVSGTGFVRKVAVKRALPNPDPAFAQSFSDEAKLAGQLHHPNIVPVIDVGDLDGCPFQVQELVEGLDLSAVLSRAGGRIHPEIALHITAQVGEALAYAHRARDARGRPMGIVHRDVTPENILISWEGDVKLADFGNAFAWRRSVSTEIGIIKGKLFYLSPEQARGETATPAADIFALGCVLHELVAGRSPLEGLSLEQIAAGMIARPESTVPSDVATIVRRASNPSVDARHRGADELAAECTALLAHLGVHDARSRLRALMAPLSADSAADSAADRAAEQVRPQTAIFSAENSDSGGWTETTELRGTPTPDPSDSQLTERGVSPDDTVDETVDPTPVIARKVERTQRIEAVRVEYSQKPRIRRVHVLGLILVVAFTALAVVAFFPGPEVQVLDTYDLKPPAVVPRAAEIAAPPPNVETEPVRPPPRAAVVHKTPQHAHEEIHEAPPLTADVVESRLKRLFQRLNVASKELPAARVAELERAYFDLRSRFRRDLDPNELRSLLANIEALEQKLSE